jgi:prepilin-type N-terminal cleavage/methylation domain-containing protein
MQGRTSPRHAAFTLVELLVVVAIMALLIAILLPALNKVRYTAKITVCLAQMRQMATGLFDYTNDYRGFYPDGEWGRPDPAAIGWIESGGHGVFAEGDYDLRPALRKYFGVSNLNDLMTCPLAASWWQQHQRNTAADLDQYRMGASNLSKSPYALYFGQRCSSPSRGYIDYNWPRAQTMRTRGQNWTPASVDTPFSVLLSDFVFYNGWQGVYLATTHQAPDGTAPEGSNYTNYNYGHRYEPDQNASANFMLNDGSADTYLVNLNDIYDGSFTGIRRLGSGTYMVPTDTAR